MKKVLLIKIWATLFALIVSSCGGKERNEDSIVTADHFEVGVLEPSDAVKKTIENAFLPLISDYPVYHKDSICLNIECNAIWDVTNNEDPSSIRVISMDTTWFYLTINEGGSTELIMNWDTPKERSVLRTIKSILDTGTFSLYCINHDDVSPKRLLNAYFDSIARTEINCTICLSDSSWDNHQ
jgi:hypothetical protein